MLFSNCPALCGNRGSTDINGMQQQLVSWVSVPAQDTDDICLYGLCDNSTCFCYIKTITEFHRIICSTSSWPIMLWCGWFFQWWFKVPGSIAEIIHDTEIFRACISNLPFLCPLRANGFCVHSALLYWQQGAWNTPEAGGCWDCWGSCSSPLSRMHFGGSVLILWSFLKPGWLLAQQPWTWPWSWFSLRFFLLAGRPSPEKAARRRRANGLPDAGCLKWKTISNSGRFVYKTEEIFHYLNVLE